MRIIYEKNYSFNFYNLTKCILFKKYSAPYCEIIGRYKLQFKIWLTCSTKHIFKDKKINVGTIKC